MEKLWTTDQVAELFQVTKWTVRKWVSDPEHPLQGVKIGKAWRIPEHAVRAFANDTYGDDNEKQ